MHSEILNLTCPHCDQNTLIASVIPNPERVSPEFVSHICLGQDCECENSKQIKLIHTKSDDEELMECVYEYSEIIHSRHPIFDSIFGRF